MSTYRVEYRGSIHGAGMSWSDAVDICWELAKQEYAGEGDADCELDIRDCDTWGSVCTGDTPPGDCDPWPVFVRE
jgi:hypothetical protein